MVYDIEFYSSTTEYEYVINAQTGKVVNKSKETRPSTTEQTTTYIGVDKAKSIAVSHAGLKLADITFTKAKLENDDGHVEYEIEFYSNGMEYEYSIDASKGSILEYDIEEDD